jgi:hypothetical protein
MQVSKKVRDAADSRVSYKNKSKVFYLLSLARLCRFDVRWIKGLFPPHNPYSSGKSRQAGSPPQFQIFVLDRILGSSICYEKLSSTKPPKVEARALETCEISSSHYQGRTVLGRTSGCLKGDTMRMVPQREKMQGRKSRAEYLCLDFLYCTVDFVLDSKSKAWNAAARSPGSSGSSPNFQASASSGFSFGFTSPTNTSR